MKREQCRYIPLCANPTPRGSVLRVQPYHSTFERRVFWSGVLRVITPEYVVLYQDISALCRAVKQTNPDIIFHCDASQSVGKMAVDVKAMGIDMLTLAAHKLYARVLHAATSTTTHTHMRCTRLHQQQHTHTCVTPFQRCTDN
jgi:hypothetical protein